MLALVGAIFPAYGSTYVKQLGWWYEPEKERTGILFATGPIVSLALAFAFWSLPALTSSNMLAVAARVGYTMNLLIVIFNLIPIQAAGGFVWDGKKTLAWRKAIWVTLVVATSALILLGALF